MAYIVVFDYGFGNVRSMVRAIANVGAQVELTNDRKKALQAGGLVVPGVGAFSACMDGLISAHGDEIIYERISSNQPVLGVCVGEQVMFNSGNERGEYREGLGLIGGDVSRIQAPVVPHMGWNTVQAPSQSSLFNKVGSERFYFVHSYAAHDDKRLDDAQHEDVFSEHFETMITHTKYGKDSFVAGIEKGPLTATQFHPEKSGEAGAQLLRNWISSFHTN